MKGRLFTKWKSLERGYLGMAVFVPDSSRFARENPDLDAEMLTDGWEQTLIDVLEDFFPPATWNVPIPSDPEEQRKHADKLLELQAEWRGAYFYTFPIL